MLLANVHITRLCVSYLQISKSLLHKFQNLNCIWNALSTCWVNKCKAEMYSRYVKCLNLEPVALEDRQTDLTDMTILYCEMPVWCSTAKCNLLSYEGA